MSGAGLRVVACAGLLFLLMASCTTGPCGCSPPECQAVLVRGDGQAGPIGQALPFPITVQVDAAGIWVSFRPAVGSGTVASPSIQSDKSGRAATIWTVGGEAGVDSLYISGRGADVVDTVAVAHVSAP